MRAFRIAAPARYLWWARKRDLALWAVSNSVHRLLSVEEVVVGEAGQMGRGVAPADLDEADVTRILSAIERHR